MSLFMLEYVRHPYEFGKATYHGIHFLKVDIFRENKLALRDRTKSYCRTILMHLLKHVNIGHRDREAPRDSSWPDVIIISESR